MLSVGWLSRNWRNLRPLRPLDTLPLFPLDFQGTLEVQGIFISPNTPRLDYFF